MRRLLCLAVLLVPTLALAEDKPKDTMLYELRIYTAEKGKLDGLKALVRDHGSPLLEKLGAQTVGVWQPLKGEEKLYILLEHKGRTAREETFKKFSADEGWKKVYAEATKDGPLAKQEAFQELFLTLTDYSPPVKAEKAKDDRIFELRSYTATKGNLAALDSRFRDHTLKLFEKHGMTNLPYFHLAKGGKGDDVTLIYFLAHKSEEERNKSFGSFGKDEDWTKARKASEEKAGGSLTEKEGGVKSVLLKATDFSPTK